MCCPARPECVMPLCAAGHPRACICVLCTSCVCAWGTAFPKLNSVSSFLCSTEVGTGYCTSSTVMFAALACCYFIIVLMTFMSPSMLNLIPCWSEHVGRGACVGERGDPLQPVPPAISSAWRVGPTNQPTNQPTSQPTNQHPGLSLLQSILPTTANKQTPNTNEWGGGEL